MRHDMSKVIVERPRVGVRHVRKGRAVRDVEDHPRHQGMRRPYGYRGKEITDHFKPLLRFLQKRVGRPWNKVYSEICEHLHPRSTMHQHLRRHVFDFVDVNGVSVSRYWYSRLFYVDGRSGLLRSSKPRKPR